MPLTSPPVRRAWIERSALLTLFAVTLMAAAGYSIYALHPERLAGAPGVAAVYTVALRVFPIAQVIVGVLVLAVILSRHVGRAWLPAAVTLYLVSLASELVGTTAGLPFGPYHYTDGLGIKWFSHVPILIPASWFMMALPSFALATRWVTTNRFWRVVVAAGLLVSWDLALDPAMSRLMPYWIWGSQGPYYGMPLLNLAGWYVTGLALMAALTVLSVDRWLARVPTMPLAALYVANLMLPVIMAAAAGLWPAALFASAPFGILALVTGAHMRSAA